MSVNEMQPEAGLRDRVTAPIPIKKEPPKFRNADIPVALATLGLSFRGGYNGRPPH